ncbi:hypothetical protein BC826DRAFT_978624 [Russula brevipes]|nr:hypothetical protein BC826DRAFT_978624 [Russula brevipes]
MRPFHFYSLLLVPFALTTGVLAQNSTTTSNATAQVTVFTSVSTGLSLGPNRETVPFTVTIPITTTLTPNNSTSNGNSTNNTSSATSTKPTSTGPLPTAPTDVNGGGNGPGGAPSPGQTGQGGVYGPPDGYVSGVSSLQRNAMVVGIAGVIVGVLLPFL